MVLFYKFSKAFDIAYALKRTKATKTQKEFEVYAKRLLPFFGKMRIKYFEKNFVSVWSEYVKYRSELEGGLKTSLFHDRKIFTYILNICYKHRWCRKFRVQDFDIPFHEGNKKTCLDIVTKNEILLFTRDRMSTEFHTICCLGLLLGMRKNEVLGLRKDEINLAKGYIKLKASRVKTRTSRIIPLNNQLTDLLSKRISKGSLFLFPSKRLLERENIDSPIKCIKRDMEILQDWFVLKFNFKDFRTTCATHMIKAGISSELVAKTLGHSTKVLLEYYHQIDDEQLEEIREFSTIAS